MKTTVCWLRIEGLGRDWFSFLRKAISDRPFSEDTGIGFRIEDINSRIIRAVFIVREEIRESIEDPFGRIIENYRASFDVSFLTIRQGEPYIEVVNPGKKLRTLHEILRQSSGENLIFELIAFETKKIVRDLEKNFDDVEVISIETNDLLINNRTACSLSFKALVDVRADVAHFLSNRGFEERKLKLRFKTKSTEHWMEMSAAGRHAFSFDIRLDEYSELRRIVVRNFRGA